MFTCIFTAFLKNRNFISKIRISKVTDYAALTLKESNDQVEFIELRQFTQYEEALYC